MGNACYSKNQIVFNGLTDNIGSIFFGTHFEEALHLLMKYPIQNQMHNLLGVEVLQASLNAIVISRIKSTLVLYPHTYIGQ